MNMMKMMQKAGQMKAKMQDMQERVQQMEIEGEAGNGMVKCQVNGRFQLKAISIDKSLVNADDIDLLEDTIVAAMSDAHKKAEEMISSETHKVMSDLGLPSGFELPF